MEIIFSGQTYQFISWFIVLLACITGLYCLVINFGGRLNRFVFFFAFIAALRHMLLAFSLNQASLPWLDDLRLLDLSLVGLLRSIQLMITILLLTPNWWRGKFRWPTRIVVGASLLFPVIILTDVLFNTKLYYAGLSPDYEGGYIAAQHIIKGDLYSLLDLFSVFPTRGWVLGLVIYVLFVDKQASRLTRKMATWILVAYSAIILAWIIPNRPEFAVMETLIIVGVGSFGYLAAIFLKIFSEPPFHRGSLQNRLINVSIATTIPILVTVGILAQQSVWAAWSAIMVGISLSVVLTWLTIRYSISPIQSLTDTAAAITAGDLSREASVFSEDEVGKLALAFNSMTKQLRMSIDNLEARVSDRTRALKRRTNYLETSNRVGQHATSILDQQALLREVADLIQAGFGYYFVSIWLIDTQQNILLMQAKASRSGKVHPEKISWVALSQAALIVSVCKAGTFRLVNDVLESADFMPDPALPDTRAELCLPLYINDETIGVLDIQSDELNAFNSDDSVVFQTLANEIAIAIRNAQLYEKEQQRRKLAEALQNTGRRLSSSLDLSEIPALILDQLSDIVPYSRASVLLQYDQFLRIEAQRGFPDDHRLGELEVPIRRGDVYQQVVGTSRPVIINNVADSPHWYQVDWLPLDLSWMGVPLVSQDRVIGMISLTRSEVAAFSDEAADLVSAFAGHATIALENAKLYDQIRNLNEKLEMIVESRTDELNRAYQNLTRLDQTKSDFIKVVAHELRTPLTVIDGYTQILNNKEPQDSASGQEALLLDGIMSGVERMQEIVNKMLDLTKLENDVLTVHKEETILLTIVEKVGRQLKQALQERNLSLQWPELAELPTIPADAELLYKLFYQLIINAIKYVPDGGTITISGKTAEGNRNSTIEIVVSDTGIGIDPSHHDLIFEKFYQTGKMEIHSSGKTSFKGGGPGLGLAIAQAIVLAHQGQIWVESLGHNESTLPGSHFHVVLPLNGVGQSSQSSSTTKKKIEAETVNGTANVS
ncbi:MAG: GAF domain-containing protein [Chloroflexota bacterium]